MLRKKIIHQVLLVILLSLLAKNSYSWGFHAHRTINRHAVFTLPPEMFGFFKAHIEYITEHAVDPDKRSIVSEKEAVRHYIDIDHYGSQPFDSVPMYWNDAVLKYTEDTLNEYGINPWFVQIMFHRLTQAFEEKDADAILFNAANLGHYIADATVPLHTTQFYDGKTKEQKGIHAFWETRMPELFSKKYNLLSGRSSYIKKPLAYTWSLVKESHYAVDSIFATEEYLRKEIPDDLKYTFVQKGQVAEKVFSEIYSTEFEAKTNYLVKRKLITAIAAVGNLWYSAWVNAGQPNLDFLDLKETGDNKKASDSVLLETPSYDISR